MEIETLKTERLKLVGPEPRHFEAYAALVSDPLFMRKLEQYPMDRLTAHRNFCSRVGHWVVRGWGNWMLEDEAGTFLGVVGINDWEGWPEPELGWWVVRRAWGKGYAAEAARAVLAWAGRRGRQRLISLVRPTNVQSIRVAEKLGAVHESDIHFMENPARVYVHTPSYFATT